VREKVLQDGALDDPILGLGMVSLSTFFCFSERGLHGMGNFTAKIKFVERQAPPNLYKIS